MHTKKTVMIKTIETRDGEVRAGQGDGEAGGTEYGTCPHAWGSGAGMAWHLTMLLSRQVVSEATQQQHEVL